MPTKAPEQLERPEPATAEDPMAMIRRDRTERTAQQRRRYLALLKRYDHLAPAERAELGEVTEALGLDAEVEQHREARARYAETRGAIKTGAELETLAAAAADAQRATLETYCRAIGELIARAAWTDQPFLQFLFDQSMRLCAGPGEQAAHQANLAAAMRQANEAVCDAINARTVSDQAREACRRLRAANPLAFDHADD